MNLNTKILLPVILITCFASLAKAQKRNSDYENYIRQYKSFAIAEQKKYGIPASITLAQGLLESGAGKSSLATTANNHFGIKCRDWKGATVYKDDDEKNECFRKYSSAKQSYEDHSTFLATGSRYASLFALKSTDYKGWAKGLQAAGYATEKTYASDLIGIIELYELNKLDVPSSGKQKEDAQETSIDDAIADKSLISRDFGEIEAYSHKVYKNNGIKYILAGANDTYASIAKEFNLIERVLRYQNEINDGYPLNVNDVVYLGNKKNKAAANVPATHTVVAGESMYSISQYYGIKIKKLYQLNNIPFGAPAQEGWVLRIR